MLNEKPASWIARDYECLLRLFASQPASTRSFLESQAKVIMASLGSGKDRFHYHLPEQVTLEGGELLEIPLGERLQAVGSLFERLLPARRASRLALHLKHLEKGLNPGLSVCARLLSYALARWMIHALLPVDLPGNNLLGENKEGSSTAGSNFQPALFLKVAGYGTPMKQTARYEAGLEVLTLDYEDHFSPPRWVTSGEKDQPSTASLAGLQARVDSLQAAVHILRDAEALCPSVVADEAYQHRRASLYEQLAFWGNTLALLHTRQIISRIRRRAQDGDLDRGMRLSLPYFELEDMTMHLYQVEIIPAGRIMFNPGFVVQAMRTARKKVLRDMQVGLSARQQLLAQLAQIENAFNLNSEQD